MPRRDRKTYRRATHTRAIVRLHHDDFPGGSAVEFNADSSGENESLIPSLPPVPSVPGGVSALGGSSVRRITGRLLGVQTQKQLGASMGSFTVTIKKNMKDFGSRSLLRVVPDVEDIWVEILFVCDGQTFYTMLGLVDSIKETVQRTGNGQRQETYTITGSDFGKVFEKTSVFINHFVGNAGIPHYSSVFDANQTAIDGNPAEVMRGLIHAWIKNHDTGDQGWKLPQSLNGNREGFGRVLVERIQKMGEGNGKIFDVSLFDVNKLGEGQSLWSVLQEYANPILNEMWVDVQEVSRSVGVLGLNVNISGNVEGDPDRFEELHPAFFFRERPWPTKHDHKRWDKLRINRLEQLDVQRREIAKGGAANRFNFWVIQPSSLNSVPTKLNQLMTGSGGLDGALPGDPGHFPIYSNKSIERHGLRKWEQSTKYLPFADLDNDKPKNPTGPTLQSIAQLASNWLRKCHDWYVVAPLELSGTITSTRVMPEARVGQKLKEERNGEPPIDYYIEGISHAWQYPGAGSTTFTLTRGEYESEDLINLAYKDYENSLGSALSANADLLAIRGPTDADAAASLAAAQQIPTSVDPSVPNIGAIGNPFGSKNPAEDDPLSTEEVDTTRESFQADRLANGDPFAIYLPPGASVGDFDAEALEADVDIDLGLGDAKEDF